MCASTRPGRIHRPCASRTWALSGTATEPRGPAARTVPSRMTTTAFSVTSPVAGSNRVPPRITRPAPRAVAPGADRAGADVVSRSADTAGAAAATVPASAAAPARIPRRVNLPDGGGRASTHMRAPWGEGAGDSPSLYTKARAAIKDRVVEQGNCAGIGRWFDDRGHGRIGLVYRDVAYRGAE